jgi:site-specific DNA-methyltransferase (adenine-specific)
MFPPHIPRVFVEWLTDFGDVVYDPFSGRGTAPMEACRLGRIGLGSDANPLAYVLTAAKVDPPTMEDVTKRLDTLDALMPTRIQNRLPDDIRMLYSPKVQRQLSWLKEQLRLSDQVDRFIISVILGLLHANYKPGSPARGFSISMPNTFSMSPSYVRDYIAEHQLHPPIVDVIEMVRAKVQRMCIPESQACRGRAWKADARVPTVFEEGLARLVFTSPPYLGVIKYGKYNWIRLWMLGHNPREVDNILTATASLRTYLNFMIEVISGLHSRVRSDGYLCLMIGDVTDKSSGSTLNLADMVWRKAAKELGWRRLGVLNDQLPEQHKVSRIWGGERRGRATKVDRILVLAPPGSNHVLPRRPRSFAWNANTEWARSSTEEV